MGLELCRDLASWVKHSFDIPVFQGYLEDAEFSAERYNLIITSQVFEHLLDPKDTLNKLCHHLEMPGLLLIDVPNIHAVRERVRKGSTIKDPHLFYFCAKSLSRLLVESGFEIITVVEGLRPYRNSRKLASTTPMWLLGAVEKIFSFIQMKTGLTILAQKNKWFRG